jgi:hypothetical protein
MLMQGTAVSHTSVEAVIGQLESLIAELQHSVARSIGRRLRDAKRQAQAAANARAAAAAAAANAGPRGSIGARKPLSSPTSIAAKKGGTGTTGNDRWSPIDISTVDLRSLLQNGLFALERMASEAAPILILLTDGNFTSMSFH